MARITVLDLPEMTLWYHSDKRVVHHRMHRYPGTKVLESVLQKGLETLRDKGAHRWLSDDSKGGALPRSHHEWAANVWGPAAAAAGWKYWALLPPSEVVGQMNMARLRETYSSLGVTVQVFTNQYAAMAWLTKCPE